MLKAETQHLWVCALSSKGHEQCRSSNDEDEKAFSGFPPYDLRKKKKLEVLGALNLLAPYGSNVDELGWSNAVQRIRSLLRNGIHCARPSLVWMSMTHGDMNSHNVLLLENPAKVVFIDLAWMKDRNHTLHDYARIEAEFKFAFMECGPLRDTYSNYDNADDPHIKKWLAVDSASMERFLDCDSKAAMHSCVAQCYQMISRVRTFAHAKQVDELKLSNGQEFENGYKAALLHVTLNAITYEMPYAKRILAVLSAGKLIDWLKEKLGRA